MKKSFNSKYKFIDSNILWVEIINYICYARANRIPCIYNYVRMKNTKIIKIICKNNKTVTTGGCTWNKSLKWSIICGRSKIVYLKRWRTIFFCKINQKDNGSFSLTYLSFSKRSHLLYLVLLSYLICLPYLMCVFVCI